MPVWIEEGELLKDSCKMCSKACIYQREEDSLWALSVAAHMSSPHQGLPQLRSDVGVTVLLRHHKEMVTACTETFDRFSSTLEVISKYLR